MPDTQQDDEEEGSDADADADDADDEKADSMQTFVFSATLSKDLQRNLKKRQRPHKGKKHAKPASTLGKWSYRPSLLHRVSMRADSCGVDFPDDLVMRLDFRDPEPEVIDLSPEGGVVSTLKESKIDCLMGDKVRP